MRTVDRCSGAATWFDDADSIVLAMGQRAENALHRALKGRVAELHLIGDALAPRRLDDAILDGERAGRML